MNSLVYLAIQADVVDCLEVRVEMSAVVFAFIVNCDQYCTWIHWEVWL